MPRFLIPLFLIFAALPLQAQTQPPAQQAIPLELGWNLVSIQVGGSITPAAFKASLPVSDQDRLVEIWGYDASGNPAVPGSWKVFRFGTLPVGFPNDLATVSPGRGYWIKIATGRTTATLNAAPWDGSVSIHRGWNLVGFPGLAMNADEIQELSAIFGSSFNRIQQVWGHDAASNRFLGYDTTAIPQLKELAAVSPGKGYWVYSIADTDLTLSPSPYVALPADSDASPPQAATLYTGVDPKYVGKQVRLRAGDGSDTPYDLNANGILDDPYTQDTILFEKTADTVSITIGNKGSGVLTWALENNVSWIYTAPADPRTWPTGVTSRPAAASGTVSTENDTLMLYADRSGMTPGRKTADLTLWVGGQPKTIHVLADVADISGDWSGVATTTRVNGKAVSIGDVRLAMNAFLKDGETEGSGFRAVMDREKAILFPRDVFLEGLFYSAKNFQLNTNFEMPAGDRNAPPYATFPGDPNDRDRNGDGRVDVMNPFPFGIRREVTLLGTRISPDRLEGSYIESIRGMLPPLQNNNLINQIEEFKNEAFLQSSQAIVIEGSFVLQRNSFEPTKRSVFNETSAVNVPLGGTDTQISTQTLTVGSKFNIQGVKLSLDFDFPDPALIRVTLIAPDGTVHVVHNFGDTTLPDGSLIIPIEVFQGHEGFGDWQLQIEWDTTERGTLHSWGLDLEGISTHRATGRVVTSNFPLSGANLRLEGSVQPQQLATEQDGVFTFDGLTENDYTLFITKPGYEDQVIPFFIGEADKDLGDIALSPINVDSSELRASPAIGFQKLTTKLNMVKPAALDAIEIAWNFGDGSGTLFAGLDGYSVIEHTFDKPGIFTVTATLYHYVGDTRTFVVERTIQIHVLPSRPNSALSQPQIVQAHAGIIGTLGARMDALGSSPAALPVPPVTELPDYDGSGSMASATVYQESKWDLANFDLDRAPVRTQAIPFRPDYEDTDFSGQTYVYYDAASKTYKTRAWRSGDPTYDLSPGIYSTYPIPSGTAKPTRFRMAVVLGGAVFSPEKQSLGGLTIQQGRTIRPPTN